MIDNNSQHTHRIAFFVALGVTVALIILVTIFGSSVYQSYIEVESDRLLVVTDKAKESSLVRLKELVEETVESKESLAGFVITKDNLAKFIDLIEEVGEKQGAETSVVSVNELGGVTDEKKALAGWQLELRLVGSFDQVWQGIKFIEALPVAKRIVRSSIIRTSVPGSPAEVGWGGSMMIELPTTN